MSALGLAPRSTGGVETLSAAMSHVAQQPPLVATPTGVVTSAVVATGSGDLRDALLGWTLLGDPAAGSGHETRGGNDGGEKELSSGKK